MAPADMLHSVPISALTCRAVAGCKCGGLPAEGQGRATVRLEVYVDACAAQP